MTAKINTHYTFCSMHAALAGNWQVMPNNSHAHMSLSSCAAVFRGSKGIVKHDAPKTAAWEANMF